MHNLARAMLLWLLSDRACNRSAALTPSRARGYSALGHPPENLSNPSLVPGDGFAIHVRAREPSNLALANAKQVDATLAALLASSLNHGYDLSMLR